MGASSVVAGLILGQDRPQVPLAEDQHPVGDLGPGGEHEPFCVSVRARAAGRDLHDLDCGVGQGRAGRRGELPGPVTVQEPEAGGAITEIGQEVADLLHGPGTVGVRGDPGDVQVAGAGLYDEQAGRPLESHRAVAVEEVGGEHRGCLGMQELPPRRVGATLRCRGIFSALRTRRIVDAPAWWPGLSSSPWIRWYPQPLFSGASRSMSAAIPALTGGRPVRLGQVHWRVTRRRCQRRTVPGVISRCARTFAGRSRISAAGNARPAQSSRGRG